ncbi:MAG: undecaprenyl/decaprenyl-phosphate alpha-N-acetylglucosaminyl 1-phosphate transferase [Gorillibacterium sp.]|nr:undecaprenyl/decaprenyl-phosphate alpha-N-acetylglucosaminyl 1-phosphate transferase [Gorillibacterium sp.]
MGITRTGKGRLNSRKGNGGNAVLYAIPLFTGAGIVLLLVPIIRRVAISLAFVDLPGSRKIHSQPVPLMGGLAIYFGVIIPMLLFGGWSAQTKTVLVGGTILVLTGLLDDWWKTKGKDFPVWPRLIIYLVAASVPLWFGIEIIGVMGLQKIFYFPQLLAWFVTVVWVFAISNMINFIDGVDGLASGIVTIASAALFIAALWQKQVEPGILAAIMCGVCISFLVFNFYPAKIFMGDAGAIFLGYTIAVLSVNGSFKSATVLSILVPILALGVPILDTTVVFMRRLMRGGGLHKADKLHTHHILMRWGLTQAQTVAFMYLIEIAFTLLAVIVLLSFRK